MKAWDFNAITGTPSGPPKSTWKTKKPPTRQRANATHEEVCARCDEVIKVGARIAHYPAGWSHVICPTTPVTPPDVEAAQVTWPTGKLWDRLREAQLEAA